MASGKDNVTMPGDRPAIIDDVRSASAHLSALGLEVVFPAAASVRRAVLQVARARGWGVIDHSQFGAWVHDIADNRCQWLVLDPLIAVQDSAPYAQVFRLSRVLHASEWRLELPSDQTFPASLLGRSVGFVDDAVASGSTIRRAISMAREAGAVPTRVVVACATSVGRAAVASEGEPVAIQEYTNGGHVAVHLRDACPFLPFGGRPSAAQPAIDTPNGKVNIRLPSLTRHRGLWASLFSDHRVLAASVSARAEVTNRLSEHLNREAKVGDLPLLGPDVALPAYPRHSVTTTTALRELM